MTESYFDPKAAPGREEQFHMRIDRDGLWHHRGRPMHRKRLAKLFATILKRDANGGYWLANPVEYGRIEVEDAPYLAVDFTIENSGEAQILHMRGNLDHEVTVDETHPLYIERSPATGQATPYVMMTETLPARLTTSVFHMLADHAVGMEDENGQSLYGIWSSGIFFPLEET